MADQTELKRDLWDRMSKSPFLMVGLTGSNEHSEPLTAQLDQSQVDTLWFFIGRDNRLAKRRRGDGAIRVQGARLFRLPVRQRPRRQ